MLNEDQTRTDYWRMDLPHAPYSFMLAVGEFADVQDEWNDIPVNYYVEPAYEPYAKPIFGHTPEMLDLFSEKLDYPYPWPKYSQVIVRDFPTAAVGNTTASIFTEALQVDDRELLDRDYDDIIAHELFHQAVIPDKKIQEDGLSVMQGIANSNATPHLQLAIYRTLKQLPRTRTVRKITNEIAVNEQ